MGPVIIANTLMTLGFLGVVISISRLIRGDLAHVFTGPVFSLGLIAFGIATLKCHRRRYRLTGTTIVGGLMLFFVAFGLADEMQHFLLGNTRINIVAFVAVVLFMGGGFALLRHGHRRHAEEAAENSLNNNDT